MGPLGARRAVHTRTKKRRRLASPGSGAFRLEREYEQALGEAVSTNEAAKAAIGAGAWNKATTMRYEAAEKLYAAARALKESTKAAAGQ